MVEIWKFIPDYENLYMINNFGEIKGCKKKVILKGNSGSTGYIHVVLSKSGKYKTKDIHRLVAQVFIPNPNNYKYVNHKDGDKKNNKVDNLEWCTARENTNHALLTGLRRDKGENSSNSKLKNEDVIKIRNLSRNMTNKELSKIYNINENYVSLIVNKKRWTHL